MTFHTWNISKLIVTSCYKIHFLMVCWIAVVDAFRLKGSAKDCKLHTIRNFMIALFSLLHCIRLLITEILKYSRTYETRSKLWSISLGSGWCQKPAKNTQSWVVGKSMIKFQYRSQAKDSLLTAKFRVVSRTTLSDPDICQGFQDVRWSLELKKGCPEYASMFDCFQTRQENKGSWPLFKLVTS